MNCFLRKQCSKIDWSIFKTLKKAHLFYKFSNFNVNFFPQELTKSENHHTMSQFFTLNSSIRNAVQWLTRNFGMPCQNSTMISSWWFQRGSLLINIPSILNFETNQGLLMSFYAETSWLTVSSQNEKLNITGLTSWPLRLGLGWCNIRTIRSNKVWYSASSAKIFTENMYAKGGPSWFCSVGSGWIKRNHKCLFYARVATYGATSNHALTYRLPNNRTTHSQHHDAPPFQLVKTPSNLVERVIEQNRHIVQ